MRPERVWTWMHKLTVSWIATSPKCLAAVQDLHAQSFAPSWNNKHEIDITIVNNNFILIHQAEKQNSVLCVEEKGSRGKQDTVKNS